MAALLQGEPTSEASAFCELVRRNIARRDAEVVAAGGAPRRTQRPRTLAEAVPGDRRAAEHVPDVGGHGAVSRGALWSKDNFQAAAEWHPVGDVKVRLEKEPQEVKKRIALDELDTAALKANVSAVLRREGPAVAPPRGKKPPARSRRFETPTRSSTSKSHVPAVGDAPQK